MKNSFYLFFFILVLFSSCKKETPVISTPEISISNPLDDYQPEVENINGNLIGQVFDEDGDALKDATVKLNNQTTTTDTYGFFTFSDVAMNAKGTFVEVQADGYFQGSRRFFPNRNTNNRVEIKMLRKDFNQSFNSETDASMTFEGAEVIFSAASIRTESGEDYNGTVNFSGKWLNPTATDINQIMPGNLQGVNTSSSAVALKTLGMIAVELQDDAGNELNLKAGSTAEIRVPVPEELRENAPSEIPLWYFDETFGIWVEEGSATLQGSSYVGEVAHFSFWNCDIPTDYAILSLRLENEAGDALGGQLINIYSQIFGSAPGLTDELGYVSGIVPANAPLTAHVSNIQCGDYFIFSIEPLTEDTDLDVIVVSDDNLQTTVITGSLINCDDELIENGYFITTFDGESSFNTYLGTEFEYSTVTCGTDFPITVAGFDLINQTSSQQVDIILGENNDLGTLSVCEELSEFDYVSITIDGVFIDNYIVNGVSVNNDSTSIWVSDLVSPYVSCSLAFAGIGPGDYGNANRCSYFNNALNYNLAPFAPNATLTEFTVTQVAENRLQGIFSGYIENSSFPYEDVFIEGEFLITEE